MYYKAKSLDMLPLPDQLEDPPTPNICNKRVRFNTCANGNNYYLSSMVLGGVLVATLSLQIMWELGKIGAEKMTEMYNPFIIRVKNIPNTFELRF